MQSQMQIAFKVVLNHPKCALPKRESQMNPSECIFPKYKVDQQSERNFFNCNPTRKYVTKV